MKTGEIITGVPIPARNGPRKYDFARMAFGDSMLIPRKSRACLYYHKARHPEFCFVSRQDGEFYRVWRVASK